MRDQLHPILQKYLQERLKEIKEENCYTQIQLAEILHMSQRTVATLLKGEHSMGGLSMALFLSRLSKDPQQEIQNIQKRFEEVLQNPHDRDAS